MAIFIHAAWCKIEVIVGSSRQNLAVPLAKLLNWVVAVKLLKLLSF
jgi:hypothetical protein